MFKTNKKDIAVLKNVVFEQPIIGVKEKRGNKSE